MELPVNPQPAITTTTPTTLQPSAPDGVQVAAQRKMKKMICWGITALVILLLAPIVYTAVVIYGQKTRNSFTDQMTQWLPYPAAVVNGDWLLYRDVKTGIADAIGVTEKFAADQSLVDTLGAVPSPAEIADSEYDRLINVALLEQVAMDHEVTATDEEVDTMYEQAILSQVNGDESQVEQTLSDLYGWTVADFKALVVRELVLREELQTALVDDETYAASSMQKIKDIQTQVQADPTKFAELAIQYSEDGSASNGGDLSWYGRGAMVPEFEEASFALTEPNQVSDIVRTQFGYHLIQLVERKDATDTEEEQVHTRHILIKFSLDDYIASLAEADTVKRLVDPQTLVD